MTEEHNNLYEYFKQMFPEGLISRELAKSSIGFKLRAVVKTPGVPANSFYSWDETYFASQETIDDAFTRLEVDFD